MVYLLSIWHLPCLSARVVKLVDTTDLKSVATVKSAYRFDSGSGHQESYRASAGIRCYSLDAPQMAWRSCALRFENFCAAKPCTISASRPRALCVVSTGASVMRDMFYDGNPRPEPGAIVCRVSPSFTRFGNFEIFTARNDIDLLRKLVDYTLTTDFPEPGAPSKETYSEYKSITEGFLLVLTIAFWDFALDWLAYRYPRFSRLVQPAPLLLIKNGRMLRKNMRQEMITEEELNSQLRQQGIEDLSQIKKCYLEGDGQVSVIKHESTNDSTSR